MPDFRSRQTPVRDQGDRFACVGFAVSAAHEWYAARREHLSSEDALWAESQISGAGIEDGATVQSALVGLTTHRHAIERAWPYGKPAWFDDKRQRPAKACRSTNQCPLPRWTRLPLPLLPSTIDQIDQVRPVILTLRVVPDAWNSRDDGIVDAEPGMYTARGHAVVAVGTWPDESKPAEGLWIKNSWGLTWGVAGYGRLTRRYCDAYLTAAHVLF